MAQGGAAVDVRNLIKTFKVPEREAGFGQAVKPLFKRDYRTIEAVADISFTIEPGEMVGVLGPTNRALAHHLK